jgi:hypothetical protein
MENADKALPSVKVTLGGKDYEMTPTFGTLCRFKKQTGRNPLDPQMWLIPEPDDIVGLLWAALVKNQPSLTTEEVAEMLAPTEMVRLKPLFQSFFGVGAIDETPEAEQKNAPTNP